MKSGRRSKKVTVTFEDGTKKVFEGNKFVNGKIAVDLKVGDEIT